MSQDIVPESEYIMVHSRLYLIMNPNLVVSVVCYISGDASLPIEERTWFPLIYGSIWLRSSPTASHQPNITFERPKEAQYSCFDRFLSPKCQAIDALNPTPQRVASSDPGRTQGPCILLPVCVILVDPKQDHLELMEWLHTVRL